MPRAREEGSGGGRCFVHLNGRCASWQICFVIEAPPAIASFNRRGLECASARAYIEIPFREGSSERNQVAAYIASQIGQNAQSVQTTVVAFALLEAQPIPPKSPPPEGARVRMKKGLHLAMKAFYFVRPARCDRPCTKCACVTSPSRSAPLRSRVSSGRRPAHPTSLRRRAHRPPCDRHAGATPVAADALPLPQCAPAVVRA